MTVFLLISNFMIILWLLFVNLWISLSDQMSKNNKSKWTLQEKLVENVTSLNFNCIIFSIIIIDINNIKIQYGVAKSYLIHNIL